MLKHKNNTVITNVVAVVILSIFIIISLSLVFSKGICCGDDAYHAIIAKNLANGLGYASTIQPYTPRFSVVLFDPLLGTGPTLFLPAALIIKVFGNTYWAPGLANVILWSLLLAFIGILLRKYNYGSGFAFFTFLFLYLCYSIMAYHFEHWYALLGEVPAALLIVLGVLYYLYQDARLNQILTGVLFSLAVQAKLLALTAFLVFLVFLMFNFLYSLIYPRNQSEKIPALLKKFVFRIVYIGIGFIIPFTLFEFWKFFTLGPFEFTQVWGEYLKEAGYGAYRTRFDQSSTLIELYTERLGTLMDRFGILLSNLWIILMLAWLMLRKDEKIRRLFFVLVTIIVVYSSWWTFFSDGRARYFIICLILLIFTISLPLLSRQPKLYVFLYFVLLIAFSSNNWARLKYPFQDVGQYFKPIARTQALLETSRILSQRVQSREDGRIITQWWATAADMEYILDTSLNFTTYLDKESRSDGSFFVMVDTRFMNKDDKDFVDLLTGCKDLQEIDVYLLAICEPSMPR